MLKQRKRTISGVTYQVTQLGWEQARSVFVRLTKMLGPALADGIESLDTAVSGKSGELSLEKVSVKSISALLSQLVEKLSEDDFKYLTDVFAESTAIVKADGKVPQLKDEIFSHFAGDFARLLKWLVFCVEVNFFDFLSEQGGIAGLLSQIMAKAQQRKSPTTSTGPFTESPQAQNTAMAS